MSVELYGFAEKFAQKQISADEFADEYIKRWKDERDADRLNDDPDDLSEQLSSIFCLSDLYCPDNDREDYELDEQGLRNEVRKILEMHG